MLIKLNVVFNFKKMLEDDVFQLTKIRLAIECDENMKVLVIPLYTQENLNLVFTLTIMIVKSLSQKDNQRRFTQNPSVLKI